MLSFAKHLPNNQGMKTHQTMLPGGRRKFAIRIILQEIFQKYV